MGGGAGDGDSEDNTRDATPGAGEHNAVTDKRQPLLLHAGVAPNNEVSFVTT